MLSEGKRLAHYFYLFVVYVLVKIMVILMGTYGYMYTICTAFQRALKSVMWLNHQQVFFKVTPFNTEKQYSTHFATFFKDSLLLPKTSKDIVCLTGFTPF